jgi:DNA gyrase subunit A
VVLASTRGWVRIVVGAFFGRSLIPGLVVHDPAEGGPLAAACWSNGDADLFLATRQGEAIRISERQVPGRRGRLGARVANGDAVVAVAAVDDGDGVFLLGDDGRGTIRLMRGFRQTKTPGSGTKQALKTERLVAALKVREQDDLFILSRLGKMIRFGAAEIPPKTGLVQGVNCMALRADETVAAAVAALDRSS